VLCYPISISEKLKIIIGENLWQNKDMNAVNVIRCLLSLSRRQGLNALLAVARFSANKSRKKHPSPYC